MMRNFFLNIIILSLISLSLFGQKNGFSKGLFRPKKIGIYNSYEINFIPFDGVSLNKGWKYILKDSLKFAKPDFDDTHWDTTSIDKQLSLFDTKAKTVGWFRKKILLDSSLVLKGYVFKVQIAGAAEIYLNGELIQKIGKIADATDSSETIYLKNALPYALVFKNAGEQTLSIRFLFNPTSKIAGNMDFYPLSLQLQKLDSFEKKEYVPSIMFAVVDGICVGLFLMMTIIHFLFHYFFRSERYNILFSSSMLIFSAFYWISNGIFNELSVNMAVLVFFLKRILYPIAHLVLLIAVYEYLKIEKKLLFWAVVVIFFSSNIIIYFTKADNIFLYILYILLIINYVFLIWTSLKNANPNGKVLKNASVGFVSLLILLAIVFVVYFTIFSPISSKAEFAKVSLALTPIFLILLEVGPQLSVSAAISLSLAQEFVKNNLILKQKIFEIETLSLEKEHILSSQNETLEKQVKARTVELNNSLHELKSTQAQLIQSEKLASLGELTAGIAHEIQNPLNFVNNFSELSVGLAQELKEEINKVEIPEKDKEYIDEILTDLSSNQEKINHHGKRASSIVKGMLEHSRISTGVKELTDINALADEYLRLAYHGLRAKDNSFNATLETHFDENLLKIEVIPQDMGRVLLNLINNAFYAVKDVASPLVIVSTENINNQIIIKIKDNGTGMSEATKTKIFQPFFTTKPTGQGTGLGLSLAYDIITKGHGGTIECESKVGEGTTFIIKISYL